MNKIKYLLLSLFLSCNIALACYNDGDSVFFEKQPFPEIKQLLTADFVKHSKEFYLWRVEDRLTKIKASPDNLSLYDDLAVAYEKSGQSAKAIEFMEEMLKKYPDRYETLANLGTFYIHDKQYKKGVELLKKAILINPKAHFGREVYQIKIVEYLLEKNPEVIIFPIQKDKESFADYVLRGNKGNPTDEILKAIVGVSGMLKFGNSDSPILMEAMGDLYFKLHQINDMYTIKLGQTYTTEFLQIANMFYVREGMEVEKINKEDGTFIMRKSHINKGYHLYDDYTYRNYLVKEMVLSQEKQIKNEAKENSIIAHGEDVETNIYQELFKSPTEQKDLFLEQKSNYEKRLTSMKSAWYLDLFDTLLKFTGVFILIIILYSILEFVGFCLKWLFTIVYKDRVIKRAKRNIKYLIYFGVTILLLIIVLNFYPIIFA